MMAANSIDVAIIGAGAAGLTAAYDLLRVVGEPTIKNNLKVKIFEASSRIGGRVKKVDGFGGTRSVVVDVGGEWLHGEPSMLEEIVQPQTPPIITVETMDWRPQSFRYNAQNDEWTSGLWSTPDDHKFINSTWYNFFDKFIATPEVKEATVLDCQVITIDYTGNNNDNDNDADLVLLECADGRTWEAQQVIVTVPVPVLQNDITFVPSLPDSYQKAIDDLDMLAGLKIILQFQTKFYEDAFTIEAYDGDNESGRFFYNPFHGQEDSTSNASNNNNVMTIEILGRFAEQYIELADQEIVDVMIQDLDRVFGNSLASTNLLDWYVQNWSAQPYTRGVFSGGNWQSIAVLRKPLASNKIIFAGEAIPYDGDIFDWGYVHGAAFSGRAAASMITATASPTTRSPTPAPTTTLSPTTTANDDDALFNTTNTDDSNNDASTINTTTIPTTTSPVSVPTLSPTPTNQDLLFNTITDDANNTETTTNTTEITATTTTTSPTTSSLVPVPTLLPTTTKQDSMTFNTTMDDGSNNATTTNATGDGNNNATASVASAAPSVPPSVAPSVTNPFAEYTAAVHRTGSSLPRMAEGGEPSGTGESFKFEFFRTGFSLVASLYLI